ncbi:MAG TPA: lipoyl(octanoyl) transferase LipB [Planctomycetaceae bacterium]|nr:lipoyl(octanoyl) transferase LipB [Planctomycetaceae bacterium]
MRSPRAVSICRPGLTRYEDALSLQRRLQEERQAGQRGDTLLLTEHLPVITLGRNHPEPDLQVDRAVLAERNVDVVQTERGGDITYHGPGQLVAYGIVDLRAWGIGAVDYVTGLEDAVIAVLARYGVQAERRADARGVWVEARKVASVGVNVRQGVTMHGIALNVALDTSGFELINPCGMPGVQMTSVSREAGKQVDVAEAGEAFVRQFGAVFGCAILPGA